MKMLLKFAIALSVVAISGCGIKPHPQVSETEGELCKQWGTHLTDRSRSDSQETMDGLSDEYEAFILACPKWEHLVP